MNLRDKEDELFATWKIDRPGFVADGIVDEEYYISSSPRLLFILKEVNDKNNGGWDLRDYIKGGGRPQTWDNVTRWVEGIRSLHEDIPWSNLGSINVARRSQALLSIGAVNVKKSPGVHVTDKKALKEIATKDKENFKKQISLYNPDLIICCGVFDLFRSLTDSEKGQETTSRGISYYEFNSKCHVVSYAHPEARCANNILYYGLIDAVREITTDSDNG